MSAASRTTSSSSPRRPPRTSSGRGVGTSERRPPTSCSPGAGSFSPKLGSRTGEDPHDEHLVAVEAIQDADALGVAVDGDVQPIQAARL